MSEQQEATEPTEPQAPDQAPEQDEGQGHEQAEQQPESATASGQSAPAEPAEPPEDLPARVEAALLTSDRALPTAKLAEALGGIDPKAVTQAIEQLNGEYEQTGRSFRMGGRS